jgi:hypothetical protein
MGLNKSKSILNQKQDLTTDKWTVVGGARPSNKKNHRASQEALYYGTLVAVATATLSLKGSWGLMLVGSLISTEYTGVGAAVTTTAVSGVHGIDKVPFSTDFTAWAEGVVESELRLYDGLSEIASKQDGVASEVHCKAYRSFFGAGRSGDTFVFSAG